jgi:hypothetical protein
VGVEENVRARGRTLAHPLIYGVNFFFLFLLKKEMCCVFFISSIRTFSSHRIWFRLKRPVNSKKELTLV